MNRERKPAPNSLSAHPMSPYYDKEELRRIDKVFVDGEHLPNCYAYDIEGGWAKNEIGKIMQAKKYGVITVTVRA